MALVLYGKTPCSLCGWKYSDAAMHRRCFVAWDHRAAFVAKYNATVGQVVWGNGTRQRIELDGRIIFEQVQFPEARYRTVGAGRYKPMAIE